jgi:hypothetical protein
VGAFHLFNHLQASERKIADTESGLIERLPAIPSIFRSEMSVGGNKIVSKFIGITILLVGLIHLERLWRQHAKNQRHYLEIHVYSRFLDDNRR